MSIVASVQDVQAVDRGEIQVSGILCGGEAFVAPTYAVSSPAVSVPEAMPWVDVQPVPSDDTTVLIGPGRFISRGGGVLIVAPTGAGKSTWSATVAFSFALGRAALGLKPNGPLRSLVIQAEDDPGDIAEMKTGVVGELNPTTVEIEKLRQNVLIVTERNRTGLQFLWEVVKPLLERHRPDLLWINPLSAYFGADLNKQDAVAAFLRNGLNPLIAEAQCAAFVIHHTAKPSRERTGWNAGELAYLGSGSADIANWSRETMVLRPVKEGLYEMACTKRWRRLGWQDADGKPTNIKLIAYGRTSQVWVEATDEVLGDLGVSKYSDSELLELIPEAGIDKKVLIEAAMKTFAVSDRTARSYVSGCIKECERSINGKRVRCALLKEAKRPRKEVYPDGPVNRPVMWLTKLKHPTGEERRL
jgi:hypothetical protein